MFEGRKLLVATKHGKEKVIAPLLEEALGVHCEVVDFDTDVFGTFSGEVERTQPAPDTVRVKCRAAMDKYQYDLGVASEGSFGPHPSLFFVPADEEFLILIDLKNGIEIMARELSTDTNFSGADIETAEQLEDFALHAGFPSHGLILKDQKQDFQQVAKGISDHAGLLQAFHQIKEKYGRVYAETDMRAHVNPTRMKVIGEATRTLVAKIKSACPNCSKPGFDVTDAQAGLPCSWCGLPTRSILKLIYECQHCQYRTEKLYPQGNKTADPSGCDQCNP